jgi:hypothetical protein
MVYSCISWSWHLDYSMFIGSAFCFWANNAANFVSKVFVFVQFLQGSSGRGWVPVNFATCPMFFHRLWNRYSQLLSHTILWNLDSIRLRHINWETTYSGPSKVERFDSRTNWNSNKKFEKNSVWNSNKNSEVEPWARHCTASCGSFHHESPNRKAVSWVLLVGLRISASSSPVISV